MGGKLTVLLVSPGPIDGYPPVQYQAKLLADAGFGVVVVTPPLCSRSFSLFEHPGVRVVSVSLAGCGRVARMAAKVRFICAIARVRWQCRSLLVAEISYDPEGVCFSHFAPFRSRKTLVVAHLHETLIDPQRRWYERRAIKILPYVDKVVVADCKRAILLQDQLGLQEKPTVVENYPLLDSISLMSRSQCGDEFRVVYVGVLGWNQSIDVIINSVPAWPDRARLYLVGSASSEFVQQQQQRVSDLGISDRVIFEGWMELPDVRQFLRTCNLGLCILRPTHDQLKFAAGASNKRYQYMQAGLPQISDTNPGVPELVEEQRVGFCVAPDDGNAIAQSVRKYCEDPSGCAKSGERAFELYRTRYHYEVPFQKVIEWIGFSVAQRLPAEHTGPSELQSN